MIKNRKFICISQLKIVFLCRDLNHDRVAKFFIYVIYND